MTSRLLENILSVPIGLWHVQILPASAVVTDEELLCGASSSTHQFANSDIHSMRRSELLRSRWLLRHGFGLREDPERSIDGTLVWPEGMCGSISHKQGHIAGMVLSHESCTSIGIDLEKYEASEKIGSRILSSAEANVLAAVGSERLRIAAGFAIKEAIFKAIFPVGKQRFWFEDAEIYQISKTEENGIDRFAVDAKVGERAGDLVGWDRHCRIQLQSIEVDQAKFWLACTGIFL